MKTKKRKAVKPVTLLTRIEKLLADAIVEFSAIEKSLEKNVKGLLVSAEESISKAKDFVTLSPAPATKSRPRAKAKRTVRARKLVRAA